MKRTVYTYIILVLLMSSSCEDYLGEDTNIDPTRVSEVSLEALLPTSIEATSEAHYQVALETSQVAQHMADYFSAGADIHDVFRIGTGWTNIYLRAMANAKQLERQAEEQNAPHYAGIAKIIQAINLGLATDNWENVPFTEAYQGAEELTPAYDTQQAIYETIIPDLLNSAIEDLQATNSTSSPGADDLVYRGNLEQWIKTANVLKARYAIHLTNKGAAEAANQALQALSGLVYTSNEDDFQLFYDERNLNPWHARIGLAINTGNYIIAHSEQLIEAMNGDTYGVFDPRLPIIADKGTSDNYIGMVNGTGEGNTVNLTVDTWYASANNPLLMVTYAETKFIEAEARFLANGGDINSIGSTDAAYLAYLEGIAVHMMKIGVDTAEIINYIANPKVSVGAENMTLELIMKEKWIALFLNPEAWVDLRRYDYSQALYKDFELPENHNPQLGGQFIQRASYPFDELSRNTQAVEANMKELPAEMWRDQ